MFIVKNRAIVTKVGVKGIGAEVKKEWIGKNWNQLISLGWIEEVVKKNEIIEDIKEKAVDAEIIKEKPIKIKKEKKVNIGIVKKEEKIEAPIEEIVEETNEDELNDISGK